MYQGVSIFFCLKTFFFKLTLAIPKQDRYIGHFPCYTSIGAGLQPTRNLVTAL